MPKRKYVLALACYLAIPAIVIVGTGVSRLIDPEMARGHADYVRNFRLLQLAGLGVLAATGLLALILWVSTCYLALAARQRSPGWLVMAALGPLGFCIIAMLEDRAPAPGDLYQHFIRKLKVYWRVPLEIAVFISVWCLAYELVVLLRELLIRLASFRSGTPVADIIAQQNASSGMWAAGEAMEAAYLVVLIYLLWPILFNLAGRLINPRRMR